MIQQWLERWMVHKRGRKERESFESIPPQARAAFEAQLYEPIDPEVEKRLHERVFAAVERIKLEERQRQLRLENRWYRRFFRWIRGYLAARV